MIKVFISCCLLVTVFCVIYVEAARQDVEEAQKRRRQRNQINVPRQNREQNRDRFERTPSMSPSERRPRQRQELPKGQIRTQEQVQGKTQELPKGQIRTQEQVQGKTQEQVQQFLRRSNIETQSRQRSQEKQPTKTSIPQQIENNQRAAHRAREQIKQRRPHYDKDFDRDFFERHRYHPVYNITFVNWWRPIPWSAVNIWLGWGWDYPTYYDDYGYPFPLENVALDYAQPAIAGDWLPLGVYVAAQTVSQAAYSTLLVQLALNRAGQLAGIYYNSRTDQLHPLEGVVDRATQQAVWKVSDNLNSPIMTTGLFNLTQDAASIQVHFPDGSQQTWVLVRLVSN